MANKNQLRNIGYLDFEFTREGNGQFRPTELGLAWWGDQYLCFRSLTFAPNIKLQEVRANILKTISPFKKMKTLVFWDKTHDKQILNDCGLNLSNYSLIDLQDELGKVALKDISEQFNVNSETILQYLPPHVRNKIKLSIHSAIGDALRIALLHKLFIENPSIKTTTTTTKNKTTATTKVKNDNKAKNISQNAQLFQYLETLDLSVLLIQKRVSQKTALTLWKSTVLDNPHLNIPYDSFLFILKAHLLSLI
ncbi:hypothetical protein A5482_015245 (plasmid) [Cyanobacterium sp. IPPAS B-1200]|uniref:hypothetical protein n=1 Tax=Cyanobacterium sp. IPPAS B-1200 TaxID=1562720 RepID=UPI0008525185|nr:hypothetical protein [Cyanobacterium sp. IPPAS B-1200]OEJ77712.1 hypothetical protein A5482_15210 [Cyanobacterium sp. IPPAS B-1200]